MQISTSILKRFIIGSNESLRTQVSKTRLNIATLDTVRSLRLKFNHSKLKILWTIQQHPLITSQLKWHAVKTITFSPCALKIHFSCIPSYKQFHQISKRKVWYKNEGKLSILFFYFHFHFHFNSIAWKCS